MQQRTRRLILLCGGAWLAMLGTLGACSVEASNDPLPILDASRDRRASNNSRNDDDQQQDEDQDEDKDGGAADCAVPIPKVRTNTKGFYCSSFAAARDEAAENAGGSKNCFNTELCCRSGKLSSGEFGDSFCMPDNGTGADLVAKCSAYAGSNDLTFETKFSRVFECADKAACGDNKVCCLITDPALTGGEDKANIGLSNTAEQKACGIFKAYKSTGTRCAASCGSDQIRICSTNDQCPSGKRCLAYDFEGLHLGQCK